MRVRDCDVLVVGGGLTGASLAAALADGDRRVTVLEARSGRGPRFAGELIHPAGVDVLDAHGLLAPLERAGGVRVAGFAVERPEAIHRASAAPLEPLRLPYAEVRGSRAHGFAIEHHDMVAALRAEAAGRAGVTMRLGVRVADVEREGGRVVGVRTEEGERITARLTLVAEGRLSRLRRKLGIEDRSRLVSYTAAALVRAELPVASYGHIFLGAPGPVLAYPIAPGDARDPRPHVRMCLDVPRLDEGRGRPWLAELLRERYAKTLPGPLRDGLLDALATEPPELAANHSITTRRCIEPGAALVGESGGCSHPLTASGMTVCLNDVRILREELRDAGRGGSDEHAAREIDAALARYQRRRYRFVRARELLADALYEVMRADCDGTRALRDGIFRYWQGGERARGASLALLSGHESRLDRFLTEYARVATHGLYGSLAPGSKTAPPSLSARVRSARGLFGKTFEKLGVVARGAG